MNRLVDFEKWFENHKDELPIFINKDLQICENNGSVPCNLGWACDGCPFYVKGYSSQKKKEVFVFR